MLRLFPVVSARHAAALLLAGEIQKFTRSIEDSDHLSFVQGGKIVELPAFTR